MQVAIERPNGRLVDLLLEAGHPVVPVNPDAIRAWREGEVLPGAKPDAGDAAVIAGYLRLRQHKLTVAVPCSGRTRALRTVVRTRGDLVQTRVATANQLSALLEDSWPGAAVIFADIDSPIALGFLARYPTPASAAHLGEKRMAAFCSSHGHTGRRIAAEITARLADVGFALPGTLADRMTRCGYPGCRCHADPPRRHGPYHQWPRKKDGKTATRILTDDQLADYGPWLDNHRRLRELITELEALSLAIAEADPRWNR